jgi:hypothetical protein
MKISVTIQADEVELTPETEATVRQLAKESGLSIERILEDEPSFWWDTLLGYDPPTIIVDVV